MLVTTALYLYKCTTDDCSSQTSGVRYLAQSKMEVPMCDIYMTREHVIISKGPHSLWCSREDGSLKPGSGKTASGAPVTLTAKHASIPRSHGSRCIHSFIILLLSLPAMVSQWSLRTTWSPLAFWGSAGVWWARCSFLQVSGSNVHV